MANEEQNSTKQRNNAASCLVFFISFSSDQKMEIRVNDIILCQMAVSISLPCKGAEFKVGNLMIPCQISSGIFRALNLILRRRRKRENKL